MRWFTKARMWGPEESDPAREYSDHLASLAPTLPAVIRELATGIELHDARIESFGVADGSVTFRLITSDDRGGHERVTMIYHYATVLLPRSGAIEELHLLAGDTELLYDEVDVAADGRFVHRGWVWPTGQYAIEFDGLTLLREPASAADFHSLAERELSRRQDRRLPDAWLDFEPNLVSAAARGDTGRVRDLLGDGASPDTVDADGWSALHMAARRSHLEVCTILLEAGATVDLLDSNGFTPLWWSFCSADATVAEYLADHGANPFGRADDGGVSALSCATAWSNVDALRFLVAHGAPVDARDDSGYTPLMHAAEAGDDPAAVSFLLLQGADPGIVTPDSSDLQTRGRRASELANRLGHDLVAALLHAAERDVR